MLRVVAFMLAVLVAFPAAAVDFLGDAKDGFATVGVSADLRKGSGRDKVVITLDQTKVIAAVPMMKEGGLLNPEITQTYVNTHQVMVCGVVAITSSQAAMIQLYKTQKDVDNIDVSIVINYPDDYGNDKQEKLISFSFDRALFQKINWEKLQPAKFMKIAPAFKFSQWYGARMQEEQ